MNADAEECPVEKYLRKCASDKSADFNLMREPVLSALAIVQDLRKGAIQKGTVMPLGFMHLTWLLDAINEFKPLQLHSLGLDNSDCPVCIFLANHYRSKVAQKTVAPDNEQ